MSEFTREVIDGLWTQYFLHSDEEVVIFRHTESSDPRVDLEITKVEADLTFEEDIKPGFVSPLDRTDVVTLAIPDCHVSPGQDLTRFSALGKLIVDRMPNNIVFQGDFVTLESLSAWDLGKAGKMEGRRYSEDCNVGIEALQLLLAPLRRLQKQLKRQGRSYRPRLIFLLGNHEDRLSRYVTTRPELGEHLSITKDLRLNELGFDEVIEYRGFVEIEGTLFAHAVMNAANQAISGKTALATMAQSVSKSIVIGHLHRFESVNHYRHGASDIIQIVSTGGFFEHVDDYAEGGLNAYWRGVCLLHHLPDAPGRFDVEQISITRLKQKYR